ncbi:MAG TPA: EAL domain-containing protein [Burkholderiales bacterium]|nr:EAL domain-containing protein [Burkholderiales bacterium]
MSKEDFEYSIQEAAHRLGVSIQKLRRWDDKGALVGRRTEGGHRRYPRDLIDSIAGREADSARPDELESVKQTLEGKRRIIQLLLQSERRYRDLVETSHDLIWATDAEGRFTYLNNAAVEILGLDPNDLLGRCFFDFEAQPSHVSNRRFLALLKRNGEVRNYVSHLVAIDGRDRWVGINARLARDDRGKLVGIRGTARDITEQHLAMLEIERLARHDPLTDLPNRASLQHDIESAIKNGEFGAVLFLDVDHFKYVNDNFGHRAGDQLIIGIGSALRGAVRDFSGTLYRIGGDEFAIHLPAALRQEASRAAECALEAIRRYHFQPGSGRRISNLSASVGIALYPFHGANIAVLLSNVDIAMYQAKELGRNRYVLFDQVEGGVRSTHRRMHWAKKLRDAIDDDRLVLFTQPVVRFADHETVHHEVLVRMRDDDGKIILPGNFVELAESLGIIREIDMLVVRKLIGHLLANNRLDQKVRYFVNLSRVSISDQQWVKDFISMLEESKATPSQLVFEITETAAMSEIDVTLNFIRMLKEMGCRFALDDFGAGFSSFYYLKRFEIDYLKIDGSFIRDLPTDESNQVFVKALNDVAKGMNKQVIAEWVETPEALQLLSAMGIQYGQGYLFRQPEPLLKEVDSTSRTRFNVA